MKQEASEKFRSRHPHEFGFVLISVVFPLEDDFAISHIDDTIIGNGDTVGVAAEVLQDVRWTGEGFLCIDHPSLVVGLVDEALKG